MVPVRPGRSGKVRGSAITAAALAVLAAGCAGGPAADRAASVAPAPSADPTDPAPDDGGPPPQDDGGSGPPTDDDTQPQPDPDETPDDPPPPPAEGSVDVEQIFDLEGVSEPQDLALLPDGDVLIGSRDTGTIHRLDPDTGELTALGEVPGVDATDGGGLLSVAADEGFVYVYYSTASDNRVSRFVLDGDAMQSTPAHVVTNIPWEVPVYGRAFAFGPDDMLYVGTGHGNNSQHAEDAESLSGKILRVAPDGGTPEDGNAVGGSPVYSTGYTDPTGVGWDALGRLWVTEGAGVVELAVTGGTVHDDRPVLMQDSETLAEGGFGSVTHLHGSLWGTVPEAETVWRAPLHGQKLAGNPESFLPEGGSGARSLIAGSDGQLWLLGDNTATELVVS